MTTFSSGSHVLAVPCFALAPNRLMLAVVSSPHGFETILTDVATLFQAHLVQPGRALGGRTPGKILLSRVLTATLATSCRTPLVYANLMHRAFIGQGELQGAADDGLGCRGHTKGRGNLCCIGSIGHHSHRLENLDEPISHAGVTLD